MQFDDQHCGIYAGDWDSYKDFAEVFDPLIQVHIFKLKDIKNNKLKIQRQWRTVFDPLIRVSQPALKNITFPPEVLADSDYLSLSRYLSFLVFT